MPQLIGDNWVRTPTEADEMRRQWKRWYLQNLPTNDELQELVEWAKRRSAQNAT
jgi:hypothetical protein